MTKKESKVLERKRQDKLMKKRSKDKERHKHHTGPVSENAIQHKMLSTFGNVPNFVRNIRHLASLLATEEDLKGLRFNSQSIYADLDLQKDRDALADFYANPDFTIYSEEFEPFWKAKRADLLPKLLTDDFVKETDRALKKMMVVKKGFKKDHRSILAGKLLLESHMAALTETKIDENQLWELIFNATLKENPIELPEPVTPPSEEPVASTETTSAVEPEPQDSIEKPAETDPLKEIKE